MVCHAVAHVSVSPRKFLSHLHTMSNTPSQDIYAPMKGQMMWSIGFTFAALFTGGLLTLTTICVFLLSSRDGRTYKQQPRFLRAYIILLTFVVIGFQIGLFIQANESVIFPHLPLSQTQKVVVTASRLFTNLSPVFMGGIADGVLV